MTLVTHSGTVTEVMPLQPPKALAPICVTDCGISTDDNPKVSDEPLEDGTYGYVFDFITPTGDYSMSDLATYELKNGNITTTVYE